MIAAFAVALALQDFRAGAAVVDATPPKFPVVVNGMFTERSAAKAVDPIEVRALAMDDGAVRLLVAVVDSCMVPRDVLDAAKEAAAPAAGTPASRMLVSSTHTHSAPSAMGCLGSDADPDYPAFLKGRITEALVKAAAALRPAEAAWTSAAAPGHTHTRRWILRGDKIRADPFGQPTVRAMMHPGYQNPDFLGPSGPSDPELPILSLRGRDGKPIAVLAAFGNHYFGSPLVSADSSGSFRRALEKAVGADGFVALLAQGTSGDQMWMDYGSPRQNPTLEEYGAGLAALAFDALGRAKHGPVSLGAKETTLRLRRRTPDEARLAWARGVVASLAGRKPKSQPELQALRVGDGALAAFPNEVFALTGLRLREASPFRFTMNVSLANGAEGYIPPPEQHELGGYTTWPARTAGLEVGAEPKIAETLLSHLEELAGRPRRPFAEVDTPYARAVLASKPAVYWRLGETSGSAAHDSSGRGRHARLEGRFALALDGPPGGGRAVHLVGGRLASDVALNEPWTAELFAWIGRPGGAILSDLALDPAAIPAKTWTHVAVVRDAGRTRLFLDGKAAPDAEGPAPASAIFGSRLEGRLDEVAVYERALSAEELRAHLDAAR
jgi:hypothetical protein